MASVVGSGHSFEYGRGMYQSVQQVRHLGTWHHYDSRYAKVSIFSLWHRVFHCIEADLYYLSLLPLN